MKKVLLVVSIVVYYQTTTKIGRIILYNEPNNKCRFFSRPCRFSYLDDHIHIHIHIHISHTTHTRSTIFPVYLIIGTPKKEKKCFNCTVCVCVCVSNMFSGVYWIENSITVTFIKTQKQNVNKRWRKKE